MCLAQQLLWRQQAYLPACARRSGARAAIPSAGAIAAAGPDTKAATIAAAGCSDGNLGPDFSDANLEPDFSDANLEPDFSDGLCACEPDGKLDALTLNSLFP